MTDAEDSTEETILNRIKLREAVRKLKGLRKGNNLLGGKKKSCKEGLRIHWQETRAGDGNKYFYPWSTISGKEENTACI